MVEHPSSPRALVALAVGALSAVMLGGYAVHEHRSASQTALTNQQLEASLSSTSAQVQRLNARLDAMTASQQISPSNAPAAKAPAVTRTTAREHKAHRTAKDDPRFKKLQSEIDDQGREIASTRDDLTNAKTELGGGIARNHDEIVVLQKRGERNIVEFDIVKSKQFSNEGPLAVKLKKANEKRQYADLDLMVDDRVVNKKHVNLLEPATFYAADSEQPVMVVINSITKNHIHGYVSAPKYRRSELAMAQSSQTPAIPSEAAVMKPRTKLSPQ